MMPYGLKRKRIYTDTPDERYREMKRTERQRSKEELKREVDEIMSTKTNKGLYCD